MTIIRLVVQNLYIIDMIIRVEKFVSLCCCNTCTTRVVFLRRKLLACSAVGLIEEITQQHTSVIAKVSQYRLNVGLERDYFILQRCSSWRLYPSTVVDMRSGFRLLAIVRVWIPAAVPTNKHGKTDTMRRSA